jgi:hypothetical protein
MATDGAVATASRLLGAVSLWLVGVIHLKEYLDLYSAIPTIGTLFLLSFVGATAVAVGLLAPIERLLGRFGGLAVTALALAGIAQATTQFVFLAISEQRPLFGFQEPGYDPTAILEARITEVATVALLTTFLVARTARRRRMVEATGQSARRRREQPEQPMATR